MIFSQKEKSILWTMFFIIWTMIWIRAAIIPVFPDEVFSWFLYGESGYFFQPAAQTDANNHILNSMLTWISGKLFGHSALAIRLPNVFAFIIFYWSIIKISSFQRTKGSFWISFITFSGVFYLLEFFSLSRGYGLSFAFGLFTIWKFLEFQRSLRLKHLLPVSIGILLTLSSNLSLIFTCFALLAWIIMLLLLREKQPKKRSFSLHWLVVIFTAMVLYVFYRYLSFLNDLGMLYYGLKDGFPLSTVKTLLIEVFGNEHPLFYYLLLLMLVILVLAFIIVLFRQKLKESLRDFRLVFAVLFFANIAGICFSVWFMDAAAPSDRTAAHLIILFLGALLFLKPPFDSGVLISYAQLLLLIFPVLSLLQVNLNKHHFWKDDQLSPRIYERIEKEAATLKKPVTIGGFRYFDRMYAFENSRRGNKLPTFDLSTRLQNKSDFILTTAEDFRNRKELLSNYKVLVRDNISGNILLKRKKQAEKIVYGKEFRSYDKGSNEYFDIVFIKLDGKTRNVIADVNFRFLFKGSGEQFILTSGINDSLGNSLELTEHLHLNQLKSDWYNSKLTHFTVPFFNLPENAAEIKLFLYNDKKVAHGKFNSKTIVYKVR